MADRCDGRTCDALRPLSFVLNYQHNPPGSVLVAFGGTRVLCSASMVGGVPRWMRDQNISGGWITAEYQMLPGATTRRTPRESTLPRPSGRSLEIQRLVGRSLRAVVDLGRLPNATFYVDCDVLDADGGTRCAAVTGASVALELALRKLLLTGQINSWPIKQRVAGVSVGVVGGVPLLDLCYAEDAAAEVDMNVVMVADGRFVEVQGTAEDEPFSGEAMGEMLALAKRGLAEVFAAQKRAVEEHCA